MLKTIRTMRACAVAPTAHDKIVSDQKRRSGAPGATLKAHRMCGIAGYFFTQAPVRGTARAMMHALRNRGPDSEHIAAWDGALQTINPDLPCHHALIHTRLSIIDPRPEADQPMANEAADVWICYNGEVYGWQEDARTLEGHGVRFRTRSDTEYILRAYEQFGIACLDRLRGMFAVAILDLRSRVLWLARDRLGLKPLCYAESRHGFAFGSTVRSLLPALEEESLRFDRRGIDAFLAHRYVPAPQTIMSGIRRLPNGHLLKYDLDRRTMEARPYWTAQPRSHGDWLEILEEAVRLRTVADRPLGVFLSGGIDSSVVASCLARGGLGDLQSFTAAFPGTRYDESGEAAEIAAALGMPNTAIPITMSVRDDFEQIVASLDEPFADPSCIPTWYLARETTRSVKVVLSGDGGDELLAGYKRVDKHLRSAWRRGFRLPGAPIIPTLEPHGIGKWLAECALPWPSAYMLRFSGFTPGQRRFLTGDAPLMQMEYWREVSEQSGQAPGHEPIDTLLEIDRANYLPEYILRKADLCTMAHGLELRAPLLDHVFTETVLALPHSERFTRPRKVLLKRAIPKLEPLHLFSRKKRGFNPPLEQWLNNDLAERMPELPARLALRTEGWLSAARLRAFVDRYRAGGAHLREQMLQLLVLDESLTQLDALRATVGR